MSETREIVIVGGNLGGVSVAHYLLKNTIPLLERRDKAVSYHITLVTPNTHVFFKIAAPRAFINSTLIPQEKIWSPLADAFKKFGAEKFTIVQGVAKDLDATTRTVVVSPTAAGAASQNLHYDSLILATGTTSASPLWTLHPDQSASEKAFSSFHKKLPTAKTVLISGGGAVGVESAGEISYEYKNAKVTLFSGSTRVLPKLSTATSARGQHYLEHNQHVEVIHNLRVVSSTPGPDDSTTVTLSDGTTKTVDVYIDATGGRPNTQYIPAAWLDKDSRVVTKDKYFRVRGSEGTSDANGVYVIGDIVGGSDATLMALDPMVPSLASSLAIDVAATLKASGASSGLKQKEYKPLANSMFVPIGRDGGVGQMMGWKVPSFLVKLGKGKDFLLPMYQPIVSGSKW